MRLSQLYWSSQRSAKVLHVFSFRIIHTCGIKGKFKSLLIEMFLLYMCHSLKYETGSYDLIDKRLSNKNILFYYINAKPLHYNNKSLETHASLLKSEAHRLVNPDVACNVVKNISIVWQNRLEIKCIKSRCVLSHDCYFRRYYFKGNDHHELGGVF